MSAESEFGGRVRNREVPLLMGRIADKGGKPEDQGLSFPDWACHGGGELLSLFALERAQMNRFPHLGQGVRSCAHRGHHRVWPGPTGRSSGESQI